MPFNALDEQRQRLPGRNGNRDRHAHVRSRGGRETGAHRDESTDVIVRRYLECGELGLVAGGAREPAATLVAAADKLDARS